MDFQLPAEDDPRRIAVRDIHKVFKTEAGDFEALKGINLTINRGEFVGISDAFVMNPSVIENNYGFVRSQDVTPLSCLGCGDRVARGHCAAVQKVRFVDSATTARP